MQKCRGSTGKKKKEMKKRGTIHSYIQKRISSHYADSMTHLKLHESMTSAKTLLDYVIDIKSLVNE
jgi:hypothetical protein